MRVPLGVLDQPPVISGHTPARAIAETVALARLAEGRGYGRYWLAEHHAIAALADPSPEILVSRVAGATSRIRVGTGGVLLPYYSPLKIAEQFRMLEALFPGRIDLGIGRAPGGDPRTARGRCRDRCARETGRSEEHTSELQSLAYLVCRLLLEKKKKTYNMTARSPCYILCSPNLLPPYTMPTFNPSPYLLLTFTRVNNTSSLNPTSPTCYLSIA